MGKQQSHLVQLKAQCGSSAVIPFSNQFIRGQTEQFRHASRDLLLQGMVSLEVGLNGPSHFPGGDQKRSMFA